MVVGVRFATWAAVLLDLRFARNLFQRPECLAGAACSRCRLYCARSRLQITTLPVNGKDTPIGLEAYHTMGSGIGASYVLFNYSGVAYSDSPHFLAESDIAALRQRNTSLSPAERPNLPTKEEFHKDVDSGDGRP